MLSYLISFLFGFLAFPLLAASVLLVGWRLSPTSEPIEARARRRRQPQRQRIASDAGVGPTNQQLTSLPAGLRRSGSFPSRLTFREEADATGSDNDAGRGLRRHLRRRSRRRKGGDDGEGSDDGDEQDTGNETTSSTTTANTTPEGRGFSGAAGPAEYGEAPLAATHQLFQANWTLSNDANKDDGVDGLVYMGWIRVTRKLEPDSADSMNKLSDYFAKGISKLISRNKSPTTGLVTVVPSNGPLTNTENAVVNAVSTSSASYSTGENDNINEESSRTNDPEDDSSLLSKATANSTNRKWSSIFKDHGSMSSSLTLSPVKQQQQQQQQQRALRTESLSMSLSSSQEKSQPANSVFGVLKKDTLFLYDSEMQLEVRGVIILPLYDVKLMTEPGSSDAQTYTRRRPILLMPVSSTSLSSSSSPMPLADWDGEDDSEGGGDGSKHPHVSSNYYIYCDKPIEKEG
ncbi:hypothetical protein EV182_000615, partial [Spiromyces aspiralis]